MDDCGMKRKVSDSSSVLSWLVARWVRTAHSPPPRIHSPSRVSSRVCRAVPGEGGEHGKSGCTERTKAEQSFARELVEPRQRVGRRIKEQGQSC